MKSHASPHGQSHLSQHLATLVHSAARLHLSDRIANSGLPVEEAIAPLRSAFRTRRHAVLVAPPGAGKTTLVPLRLIDEPWVAGRRIVMLEPRRLAARAAAQRMASLLDTLTPLAAICSRTMPVKVCPDRTVVLQGAALPSGANEPD